MSTFESDGPRRKFPAIIFVFLIIVVGLLAGTYYLWPRLEREPQQITFTPDSDVLGLAPMEIRVADSGAGLRAVTATLSVGGAERTLAAEEYAKPVGEKKFTLAASQLKGIKEGPAVLRVSARDGSLWRFFRGNETVLEKKLTIDVTPPTIALIADDRYVNFGGVGAIVYKASADTATSGVTLGNDFFPGFQGVIKDHPDYFFALFAHPYNAPPEARPTLVAVD